MTELTEGLRDRIRGAAHRLGREYGLDDWRDAESEITLAILEEFSRRPEFLDQEESYIIQLGTWRARDALKRECVQYVNRTVDGDAPADGEEGATLLELTPDERTWTDVELSLAVRRALQDLPAKDRRIAKMYAAGWDAEAIGTEVGLSRRSVYYHLSGPIASVLEAGGLA